MKDDVSTISQHIFSRILGSFGVVMLCLSMISCSIQLRPYGSSFEVTNFRLEIRSDTQWTAVDSDNRGTDDEFNRTIDLPDHPPPVCAVVTKRTEEGYVRARVTPGGGWVETDRPNDSISPCSNG